MSICDMYDVCGNSECYNEWSIDIGIFDICGLYDSYKVVSSDTSI